MPVMSGTASIGKCSADHEPAASSATAPSRTIGRCLSENSRMLLIMLSLFVAGFNRAKIDAGQKPNLFSSFQCFTARIEERINRLQVLLLQLYVGRNRHR